jgi:hypothetical protein
MEIFGTWQSFSFLYWCLVYKLCPYTCTKLLGNAQKLLGSLWTIPKRHWKATGKFPNKTDTQWKNVLIGWV